MEARGGFQLMGGRRTQTAGAPPSVVCSRSVSWLNSVASWAISVLSPGLHPVAVLSLPHPAMAPSSREVFRVSALASTRPRPQGHHADHHGNIGQVVLDGAQHLGLFGVVLIEVTPRPGPPAIGHRHRGPGAEGLPPVLGAEHILPPQGGHHLSHQGIVPPAGCPERSCRRGSSRSCPSPAPRVTCRSSSAPWPAPRPPGSGVSDTASALPMVRAWRLRVLSLEENTMFLGHEQAGRYSAPAQWRPPPEGRPWQTWSGCSARKGTRPAFPPSFSIRCCTFTAGHPPFSSLPVLPARAAPVFSERCPRALHGIAEIVPHTPLG